MLNQDTFNGLNINGKNILKDNFEHNINEAFNSSIYVPVLDNYLLNSNLDSKNLIK